MQDCEIVIGVGIILRNNLRLECVEFNPHEKLFSPLLSTDFLSQ